MVVTVEELVGKAETRSGKETGPETETIIVITETENIMGMADTDDLIAEGAGVTATTITITTTAAIATTINIE